MIQCVAFLKSEIFFIIKLDERSPGAPRRDASNTPTERPPLPGADMLQQILVEFNLDEFNLDD